MAPTFRLKRIIPNPETIKMENMMVNVFMVAYFL
jgi:hypothetical protein